MSSAAYLVEHRRSQLGLVGHHCQFDDPSFAFMESLCIYGLVIALAILFAKGHSRQVLGCSRHGYECLLGQEVPDTQTLTLGLLMAVLLASLRLAFWDWYSSRGLFPLNAMVATSSVPGNTACSSCSWDGLGVISPPESTVICSRRILVLRSSIRS